MASAYAGRVGLRAVEVVRLLTLGDGFRDPLPDRQHVLLWIEYGYMLRNSRQLTRVALERMQRTADEIAASANVPDEVLAAVAHARDYSLEAMPYALEAPDPALVASVAAMDIVQRSEAWEFAQQDLDATGEVVARAMARDIPDDVSPRQRVAITTRINDIVRRWNMSSKDVRTIREHVAVGHHPVHDSLRRASEWGQGPLYAAVRRYNNDQLSFAMHLHSDIPDAVRVAVRAVVAARQRAARPGQVVPVPAAAAAAAPARRVHHAPPRPASPQPPVLAPISAADAAWALSAPAGVRRSIADEVIEILDDPLSFESMDDALSAAAAVAAERFR